MKLIKLLLTAVLFLSLSLYADEEKVDVNFRDLSIKDFVEMVGKITNKNILINDDLKGSVNFVSTAPIKKSSLIPLANSILASKGLTLVDQGDFYQVLKLTEAAGEGLGVENTIGEDDTVMKTVLFPLINSNASVIRAKIKPLLHKNAEVIAFQENNTLSITANPKSLRAIKKVIDAIEKNGNIDSSFVRLKHANAKDIHPNIQNMSKKIFPQAIIGEQVDVFKDDATNTIILVGKPENMKKMISYIKQLDKSGESTTQQMYVIPLKNSDVAEMQVILSQLVSQMNNITPEKPAPNKDGTPPSKAMVVSDVERNALVILASSDQIKNIKETIARLDVPKPQVYVKAKIVEINTDKALQLGIKWGFEGGKITSNGLFTLAANAGAPSIIVSDDLIDFLNTETSRYDQNGNIITTQNRPFSFDTDISEMFALGAKLDLMQQNGAAHILSEPSVLCINNKEAEVYVGQTRSILTTAQQSTQGQGNILNNYSREDIGITLKVKPRLSTNNKVSLDVETTIEDVLPRATVEEDRPTTTKRKVKTSAIVNNGEMIVLGGLIKNSGGKNVTSVPILGDIPVLGELFKSKGDIVSKINVVIYLTPYIVQKSGDLQRLKKNLNELEEIQQQYNEYIKQALESKKSKWYESKPIENSTHSAEEVTDFSEAHNAFIPR